MRGSGVIWEALAAARARNLAAAGELAPVGASLAATRRTLLKAIAGSAAAAVPLPVFAAPARQVAIIGGGIAGLSALHHLTQAGIDARLYEARQRLGGRIFTQRPKQNSAGLEAPDPWILASQDDRSVALELGGQLVNTDHADMHALARAFGVPLIDRKTEPHRTMIFDGERVVADAELAEAMRPIAGQIGRDADRLDRAPVRVARELDSQSIAQYLDRHADRLGTPWVRRLLEATSRTEYGVEPDQASALELIFNLPTVDGTRMEVLGGADERHVLQGGSSALTDAIVERYRERIETGRRLATIETAPGGVRLRFHDGHAVRADAVIVAVPAPITRQIDIRAPLPPAWRAFIAEMQLGRNEKVIAATRGTPCAAVVGCGGEVWQTDPALQWSLGWDSSVHLPGAAHPSWTWFLGGDQVDLSRLDGHGTNAVAYRFAHDAEAGLPGLPEAMAGAFRRTGWHRQALTMGAYVNYPPGQLTRFAHLLWREDKPIQAGRIFFAGEHLSDAFPGYMNGAAQTGRLAAQAVAGRRLSRAA